MSRDEESPPRQYRSVMVSSTFTDLEAHRRELIGTILRHDLMPGAMEYGSVAPRLDVIEASLAMVRAASAYVGIISRKYGQIPVCQRRNPESLSLTELEFDEAQRLGRPILLFVMDAAHPVTEADVELDPDKRKRLTLFRERAKQQPGSAVQRIYVPFSSLPDFSTKAAHAVGTLARSLDRAPQQVAGELLPKPPNFFAVPPYISSHRFVPRTESLNMLNQWATTEQEPVLLFDAIGGSGKSLLTWHWVHHEAARVRGDWAGRFWFSFYERGAIMADFCRHALAYMTHKPVETFSKRRTPELAEQLLAHLRNRPWLLVLDGLERVLVAYHRLDAAEVRDEEANQLADNIAKRDPRIAIHPEDDDLLRALTAAVPSKILITSRLVPRVLVNPSGQAIPDVRCVKLEGMDPEEAEAMMRACGVSGDSHAIQHYLQDCCGCHPLVIGVLAGLINDYLKNPGNFDAWVNAPEGGRSLNLATLELTQRRNHILNAAMRNLPRPSQQLLSTLALLAEAVDFKTLEALHLDDQEEERQDDDAVISHGGNAAGGQRLANTVRDLTRRGLLQHEAKRYDLHPVVRGIAAAQLNYQDKVRYGLRVVDHFSHAPNASFAAADDLQDLLGATHVIRTLIKLGQYARAYSNYKIELANAMMFNLEGHRENLALLRAFFANSWNNNAVGLNSEASAYLAGCAAVSLTATGELEEAMSICQRTLPIDLAEGRLRAAGSTLGNLAIVLRHQNRLAATEACLRLDARLAKALGESECLFTANLGLLSLYAAMGRNADAYEVWKAVQGRRPEDRSIYRPGSAEQTFAWRLFWMGSLDESELAHAEEVARRSKNREAQRSLLYLRGRWQLQNENWRAAADSFGEAVHLTRTMGVSDVETEAWLALAKIRQRILVNPQAEAERLDMECARKQICCPAMAHLWRDLGDLQRAGTHALKAYEWAWADGEPYVRRHELDEARHLLNDLRVPIPKLPAYNTLKSRLPWGDAVQRVIGRLNA
jgi:tetratricopeptide (TPR) repeat protein